MCLFVPFLSNGQPSALTLEAVAWGELLAMEREIFYSVDEEEKSKLILGKSRIFTRFKKYDQSLKTLERISTYNLSANMKYEVANERVLLNFLLEEHNQVKNTLLELSLDEDYRADDDTKLIEVLNYVALHDFEKARALYIQLNPNGEESEVFDVRRLKKQGTAYNLSLVVPGSGQMYAGHFFKGMTSMAVQTFLFTYGIKGIQRQYFFTQALPSIGVFQGFYFGGAEYAKELVVKRNDGIRQMLSSNILNSLK